MPSPPGPRIDPRRLAGADRRHEGDRRRVWSRRALWFPSVVVAAALLVLVLVPIVVSARVRTMRRSVSDVVDPARVATNDLEAALAVEDTGPGIPRELREKVFEEFFRNPALRDVAPGHGIGLAVSRRVARLMEGDLRVEDRGGDAGGGAKGAVVTLWLPLDGTGGA